MNDRTITHLVLSKQDTTEGILVMHGKALTSLLHSLIREHGVYQDGSYSVDARLFPTWDKNLLLSHLVPASEYEEVCGNGSGGGMAAHALFLELLPHIQQLLEEECPVVYREAMEEAGMYSCRHRDNNETYWVRR